MTDHFRTISADPPWAEYGGGHRGAQNHYALLRTPKIARTMLDSPLWRPSPSCHLWMWATMSHLPAALSVMDSLGFRYVTHAVWVKRGLLAKLQLGLGQYLRGSHELLLLGVRGNLPRPLVAPPSVFFAKRTRHSEKPAEAYRLIEQISPGPRVEFFARQHRDGWTVTGNEIQEKVSE